MPGVNTETISDRYRRRVRIRLRLDRFHDRERWQTDRRITLPADHPPQLVFDQIMDLLDDLNDPEPQREETTNER